MALHPWKQWYKETRIALDAIPDIRIDSPNDSFLKYYYKGNIPTTILLPYWKALDWDIPLLRDKIGGQRIEYQAGRTSHADYEMQAPALKTYDTFDAFADQMVARPDNDVYITAGNQAANHEAFKPLYEDIGRLPLCLYPDVQSGFFWIGNATVTPLHHDLTNNMMCQIIGNKTIRVVSPNQFDRLQHRAGVHSKIGWLSDDYAGENHIHFLDYILKPGMALFLPVGWWHCVLTKEVSITAVYTNFLWNNSFHSNFKC